MTNDVMALETFDYDLPAELIAQEPAPERSASRLLLVDRRRGELEDRVFADLPEFLRAGDVLVANQSRVIPARLHGRLESGHLVELLLVKPLGSDMWEVMARPGRKLRTGSVIMLPGPAVAIVTDLLPGGRRAVRLDIPLDFEAWLGKVGELPIPPYIRGFTGKPERYQTVYAQESGSIAAPTAGLHFTPELLNAITSKGVCLEYVTLHVGPGTFQRVNEPVSPRSGLEAERGSISHSTADAISRAKEEGRRVVAVGTTTTRLLEGLWLKEGGVFEWSGEVDVFIAPGFAFQVVDCLITNFHLPRSTLLMLVSAFAGVDTIRRAYAYAISEDYRFYSFGDAMLIR